MPENIERLKKKLYSRDTPSLEGRRPFTPSGHFKDINSDWRGGEIEPLPPSQIINPGHSRFLKATFLISGVFFILAIIVALFTFTRGGNIVSPDNIDIAISGPAEIAGGEVLNLDISISNSNRVALESSDLLIEYPDGTRQSANLDLELKRERQSLGNISAGGALRRTIQAKLFGEAGSTKTIKMAIEYRLAGSNAIFVKEKKYDILISSSPLSFSIKGPKEISAGQNLEFVIEIVSNSTDTIENTLLSAEYPVGFKFIESVPLTAFSKDTWSLGDIASQSKRTVKLKGVLDGQDGEERTFRFNLGVKSADNDKEIGAVFLSSIQTVLIKKPFVGIELSLNGDTADEYVARSGRLIRTEIVWRNNTSENITGATIKAKLSGQAFDRNSVSVFGGFYRSVDNTIIWDSSSVPELESMEPGATGRLVFSFSSLTNIAAGSIINPEINLAISVEGKQSGDTTLPDELNAGVFRKIKISSNVALVARIIHSTGPIVNTGLIPPKADKETTYTVVWSVSNGTNDLNQAKVSAILPSYVRYTGVVSPASESVTFNPVGGEVTWEIGNLPIGIGISKPIKEVSFQIALLPSLSQVGNIPRLIEETTLIAFDNFTNSFVKDIKGSLTTRISTDPKFKSGDEFVVE